jgi:hypothetical protein
MQLNERLFYVIIIFLNITSGVSASCYIDAKLILAAHYLYYKLVYRRDIDTFDRKGRLLLKYATAVSKIKCFP